MFPLLLTAATASHANTLDAIKESLPDLLWAYLQSNFVTVAGILFALVVMGRLIIEKRSPGNIFAWGLLILFWPLVGVPLYLIFGGRKSRSLVRRKIAIQRTAYRLITGKEPPAAEADAPPVLPRIAHRENSFELLHNGIETYHAFVRHIRASKKRINIETFILGKDDITKAVMAELAEKARAGVEVRLLIDAVGSRGSWKYTKPLRDAGGKVARFLPSIVNFKSSMSANLRNHRKIAVFDDTIAIIGGQNIEVHGMGPQPNPLMNIDFSAIISGPVVGSLTRTFVSDWCFAAKEDPNKFEDLISFVPPPAGNITMESIASGPDIHGDILWERILMLINSARERCTLMTPYFVPDEVTFRTLEIKAKAGYHVRLIVPEHSNHLMVDLARNSYLHTLQAAGCEILMYRKEELLHAKLFIADSATAVMGSVNLDMRSLFVNFEIGMLISTESAVKSLEAWVARDILPYCVPYESTEQSKSSSNRRVLEDVAHIISPLL